MYWMQKIDLKYILQYKKKVFEWIENRNDFNKIKMEHLYIGQKIKSCSKCANQSRMRKIVYLHKQEFDIRYVQGICPSTKCTLEIILKTVLKKVFQPMIKSQSDFNRIAFEDV